MKKKWNREEALAYLRNQGVGIEGGFIKHTGLGGLTACSALDYLVNNHKYRVIRSRG
ncbi:MAG: hypothetical protein ACOCUI_04805 [bacterium]